MVLTTGNHLMVAHHEGLEPHPESQKQPGKGAL
jgi:hypothetical protein